MIKNIYGRSKGLIFFSFIMASVVSLTMIPYPLIMRYFVDTIIPGQNMNAIVLWSSTLLAVVLIRALCNFFQNYSLSVVENRFEMDLKVKMFEKTLKLPMGFFVKNDSGSIISRVINDSTASVGLFRDYYISLYGNILGIVISLAVMFYLDWFLTLISLSILPILLLVTNYMNSKMAKESRKMSAAFQEVYSEIGESLNAVETVKIDNLYSNSSNKFRNAAENLLGIKISINKYGALAGSLMTSLVALTPILVFITGSFRAMEGLVSIGTVIAISNLVMFLFTPLQEIALAGINMQKPRAMWKNIEELFAEEEEELKGESIENVSIDLQNIEFGYDAENRVFKAMNINLREGETVALVGKTGSGKSTLFKILSKFYMPESGNFSVGGKAASEISSENLRGKISYISRNTYIFKGNVRENISLNREIPESEILKAMQIACIDDSLSFGSIVGDEGKAVSDGQKVRIAIARAVIKKPKIFMIDEALTSLDPATEKKVVGNLKKEFPKSIFLIITHRDTVIDMCDKVYVLEHMKFSQGYNKEEIANIESFRNLFSNGGKTF